MSPGFYGTNKWRQLALLTRKRYHDTCASCGIESTGLDVHHVQPVATHPELKADPDNLVLLCRRCHINIDGRVHTNLSQGRRGGHRAATETTTTRTRDFSLPEREHSRIW